MSLIDHLWLYYRSYVDVPLTAPAIYRCRFEAHISGQKRELTERLYAASLDLKLKDCLLTFLEALTTDSTFQFLDYFSIWVSEMSCVDFTGPRLHETLELLNFNDLSYYQYRQQILAGCTAPAAEKIGYLHAERSRLIALPLTDGLACNPRWPSLKSMLCGWMAEEIAFLNEMHKLTANEVFSAQPEKYPLNVSVAHLACFLKVFVMSDLTGTRNLSRLFNFVADHFSSKRQGRISARSLSKEYYGTTQVTAAKVQGMLERMIGEINRLYFP
ncbi:hypothetical protein ACFQZI_19950 [Mucilaginibacter lutimaris]|uniref:Uncharacterized protein n=1 Tax=Mucilaginibacter lutimaris TaxID=931629 RepID=A0ABW2ZLK9_9SPHI